MTTPDMDPVAAYWQGRAEALEAVCGHLFALLGSHGPKDTEPEDVEPDAEPDWPFLGDPEG